MQLVAYGAQDVYLTGNPQITFFKVMYRRHTHFSIESIDQTFNGQVNFGKKITCTISRNGDLIHRMYLRVDLPEVLDNEANDSRARWVDNLGHALIKTVDIEIGGQRIDRQYGEWLHVWNELTQTSGKQIGYNNMIGMHPSLTKEIRRAADIPVIANVAPFTLDGVTYATKAEADAARQYVVDNNKLPKYTMYIPLAFWFNRNPGLALPLIALQYHEIKINFEFRTRDELMIHQNATPRVQGDMNATLLVDYIYMDTEERRRFAQVTHEYLIEQVQFSGAESIPRGMTNPKPKLQLNHPCKELIFMIQPNANVDNKKYFDYSFGPRGVKRDFDGRPAGGLNNVLFDGFYGAKNPLVKCGLQLNGHDRFSERDGMYFNMVQPYQHHENVPATGINVYSFALKPEEHQPSGTCNMSRIDNASLKLTIEEMPEGSQFWLFATNYNVLRIMSGMGGLAYSS